MARRPASRGWPNDTTPADRRTNKENEKEVNQYPTDFELKKIEKWPHDKFIKLMDYIETLWAYNEWGFRRFHGAATQYFALSTAGWSGNEEIIGALQSNGMFWSLCWESSRRGGHYLFKVNEG